MQESRQPARYAFWRESMAGKGLSQPVRLWRKAHQPLAENWLPWKGSVSVRVPWVLSLRLMRLWRRIPSREEEQCFIFMFFGVKRYVNDMSDALKI